MKKMAPEAAGPEVHAQHSAQQYWNRLSRLQSQQQPAPQLAKQSPPSAMAGSPFPHGGGVSFPNVGAAGPTPPLPVSQALRSGAGRGSGRPFPLPTYASVGAAAAAAAAAAKQHQHMSLALQQRAGRHLGRSQQQQQHPSTPLSQQQQQQQQQQQHRHHHPQHPQHTGAEPMREGRGTRVQVPRQMHQARATAHVTADGVSSPFSPRGKQQQEQQQQSPQFFVTRGRLGAAVPLHSSPGPPQPHPPTAVNGGGSTAEAFRFDQQPGMLSRRGAKIAGDLPLASAARQCQHQQQQQSLCDDAIVRAAAAAAQIAYSTAQQASQAHQQQQHRHQQQQNQQQQSPGAGAAAVAAAMGYPSGMAPSGTAASPLSETRQRRPQPSLGSPEQGGAQITRRRGCRPNLQSPQLHPQLLPQQPATQHPRLMSLQQRSQQQQDYMAELQKFQKQRESVASIKAEVVPPLTKKRGRRPAKRMISAGVIEKGGNSVTPKRSPGGLRRPLSAPPGLDGARVMLGTVSSPDTAISVQPEEADSHQRLGTTEQNRKVGISGASRTILSSASNNLSSNDSEYLSLIKQVLPPPPLQTSPATSPIIGPHPVPGMPEMSPVTQNSDEGYSGDDVHLSAMHETEKGNSFQPSAAAENGDPECGNDDGGRRKIATMALHDLPPDGVVTQSVGHLQQRRSAAGSFVEESKRLVGEVGGVLLSPQEQLHCDRSGDSRIGTSDKQYNMADDITEKNISLSESIERNPQHTSVHSRATAAASDGAGPILQNLDFLGSHHTDHDGHGQGGMGKIVGGQCEERSASSAVIRNTVTDLMYPNESPERQMSPSSSSSRSRKDDTILQAWADQNTQHPYPTERQKQELSKKSGRSIKTVETWFVNYRRRDWRKTAQFVENVRINQQHQGKRRRVGAIAQTSDQLHRAGNSERGSPDKGCANWEEAVRKALFQFRWPDEAKATFRAMSALVESAIKDNHPGCVVGEFLEALNINGKDHAAEAQSSPLHNPTNNECSALTLRGLISNGAFHRAAHRVKRSQLKNGGKPCPTTAGAKNSMQGETAASKLKSVLEPVLIVASVAANENPGNREHDARKAAARRLIVGVAVVKNGGRTVQHHYSCIIYTNRLKDSKCTEIKHGDAQLKEHQSSAFMVSCASADGDDDYSEDEGLLEVGRCFPNVESWVRSLSEHEISTSTPSLRQESPTGGEPSARDSSNSVEAISKWQDTWRNVLVRIPRGRYVSKAEWNPAINDHVADAGEGDAADRKGSDGPKERARVASFEHAAFLLSPSETSRVTPGESNGVASRKGVKRYGYLPLHFFHSGAASIPKPDASSIDCLHPPATDHESRTGQSAPEPLLPSDCAKGRVELPGGGIRDCEDATEAGVTDETEAGVTDATEAGVTDATGAGVTDATGAGVTDATEADVTAKLSQQSENLGLVQWESQKYLRDLVRSCSKVKGGSNDDLFDSMGKGGEDGCRAPPESENKGAWSFVYPQAPFGQIWIEAAKESARQSEDDDNKRGSLRGRPGQAHESGEAGLRVSQGQPQEGQLTKINRWVMAQGEHAPINGGGTLLGRRWVWDEGYFTDGEGRLVVNKEDYRNGREFSDQAWKMGISSEGSVVKARGRWSVISPSPPNTNGVVTEERAYCLCGTRHESVENQSSTATYGNASEVLGKRRSERTGSSVHMSNVLSELASGKLNPHTLIACEDYAGGPELRFLHDETRSDEPNEDVDADLDRPVDSQLNFASVREMLQPSVAKKLLSQPFAVRVSPDAFFVADLHAHLSESEIIGLLGGRYVESERCIYIQAAFPCKAMERSDAGRTDVEMDPVSQATAGDAIVSNGMIVVGWYHSHPTFQPDPSVTDIENQGSYQRLFQSVSTQSAQRMSSGGSRTSGQSEASILRGGDTDIDQISSSDICPFVGLIIGTYDGRNPTSRSVLRWFHVVPKETGNHVAATSSGVRGNTDARSREKPTTRRNSSSLSRSNSLVVDTGKSKDGSVSRCSSRGIGKEHVLFPMNLRVSVRKFRRFCHANSARGSFLAESRWVKYVRHEFTRMGSLRRREKDIKRALCLYSSEAASDETASNSKKPNPATFLGCFDLDGAVPLCREITEGVDTFSAAFDGTIKKRKGASSVGSKKQGGGLTQADKDTYFCRLSCTPNNTKTDNFSATMASDKLSPASAVLATRKFQDKHGTDVNALGFQLRIPPDSLSAFTSGIRAFDTSKVSTIEANVGDASSETYSHNTGDYFFSTLPYSGKETSDRAEATLSPLLLPDVAHAVGCTISAIKPAYPLPFTNQESRILWLGTEDDVTDDVHAGIIWHAIEREQLFRPEYINTSEFPVMPPPPASRAILELLFLPPTRPDSRSTHDFESDKAENEIAQLPHFNSDDVALVHVIDVLLSHYATKSHRINPFSSWSGAGEKGILGKDVGTELDTDAWWKTYYLENVMGMKPSSSSLPSTSVISGKMKRGHKICSCLLRWARHMQLHSDSSDMLDADNVDSQSCSDTFGSHDSALHSQLRVKWDHESDRGKKIGRGHLPVHIRFVAEVMRLLAARWREGNVTKRKRGRPRGRGRGRPRTFSTRATEQGDEVRTSQKEVVVSNGLSSNTKKRKR